MTTENLPAVIDSGLVTARPPEIVLEEARRAARALKDVIDQKPRPVRFGGEVYLEYEDWATVGSFYDITAAAEGHPEYVEIADQHGFRSTSVALRHGEIISRATAFCMDDEVNWRDKPLYQLASMAQTRANSKVLRNVLSRVVVLAGYKATPAEEMGGVAVIEGTSEHGVCLLHHVAFFQKGKMRTPAHKREDGSWCNKPETDNGESLADIQQVVAASEATVRQAVAAAPKPAGVSDAQVAATAKLKGVFVDGPSAIAWIRDEFPALRDLKADQWGPEWWGRINERLDAGQPEFKEV